MITIENLSYGFPQKELYSSISFTLEQGDHTAFIGTSGTGKSTLIEMMIDPENFLYDGKISIDPLCRIGYVRQFSQLEDKDSQTVFEYIAQRFTDLQNRIASLCDQMATTENMDQLFEDYQTALDTLESIGGDNFENTIEKKLALADLTYLRDQDIKLLSSGEFKLVQIIKEMLTEPTMLVMDEPDVFLDFENLTSLKKLMNDFKGILLVITHNRYLLNHCFNKIIHLENKDLQEFNGTYIEYNQTLLETKIDLQEKAIADAEEIARNAELIEKLRFIASYNTEAARGKSLKARVKFQERLEARRIKPPFVEIKQPDITLPVAAEISELDQRFEKSQGCDEPFETNLELDMDTDNTALSSEKGLSVLEVKDYTLKYETLLLQHVNFEIKAGDKVAVIGPNGTGKTSILRDIFNGDSEHLKLHPEVQLAYLSQREGETLSLNNTVLDEFIEVGLKSLNEIRRYLSRFGLDSEILRQPVKSLSGGEKNLLQLAKISVGSANLLLLDEPTSHLDTYSQLALENALNNYKGTVLMVSHDFYTIVNCMDYVLLIDDKTIRRVSMRKFRKMIYANYFDKDYLEIEKRKKEIETKVEIALQDTDFELAQKWADKLDALIKAL